MKQLVGWARFLLYSDITLTPMNQYSLGLSGLLEIFVLLCMPCIKKPILQP